MTSQVFNTFISSLSSYYGKALDVMARHAYSQAAQYVQDEDARELYKKILQNYKYFPALTEFREVVGMVEKRPIPLRNVELCWYCMDRGIIRYVKKGVETYPSYPYEFQARCPMCNNGKMYESWPSFLELFPPEALEDVKKNNLEKFGNITVNEIEAAKITAQNYIANRKK